MPEDGLPNRVNLKQIAEMFMADLQRHFDMLAFNLAARQTVQEEEIQPSGAGTRSHADRPAAPKILNKCRPMRTPQIK